MAWVWQFASIGGYQAARPQLLMISSAGVERNARIGDDAVARKADIPIVQLNPGGILNYKYEGEMAIRSSGLHYTVLRPTGGLFPVKRPGLSFFVLHGYCPVQRLPTVLL